MYYTKVELHWCWKGCSSSEDWDLSPAVSWGVGMSFRKLKSNKQERQRSGWQNRNLTFLFLIIHVFGRKLLHHGMWEKKKLSFCEQVKSWESEIPAKCLELFHLFGVAISRQHVEQGRPLKTRQQSFYNPYCLCASYFLYSMVVLL